jgi:cell division protein FtsN
MIELGTAPPAVPDGETLPAVVPQSVATAATVAPAAPSAAMPVVVSKPAPLQPAAVPPVAAEKSSAPVTVIATPPKSRVAAPKVVSHGWAVQVGSFGKRENAARMVQQAAKKGVKLAIAGPDDRGLYRVRSSIQATRAVAAQLQGELQSKGFKGIVARVP